LEFKGVSDKQWESIEPLLPPPAREGRPRADDRMIVDAILYVLKTRCPWNHLPKKYGDDVTAWRRLKEWEDRGAWKRIMSVLVVRKYATGVSSLKSKTRVERRQSLSGSIAERRPRAQSRSMRVATNARRQDERKKPAPLLESVSTERLRARKRR
jgi:transposase